MKKLLKTSLQTSFPDVSENQRNSNSDQTAWGRCRRSSLPLRPSQRWPQATPRCAGAPPFRLHINKTGKSKNFRHLAPNSFRQMASKNVRLRRWIFVGQSPKFCWQIFSQRFYSFKITSFFYFPFILCWYHVRSHLECWTDQADILRSFIFWFNGISITKHYDCLKIDRLFPSVYRQYN